MSRSKAPQTLGELLANAAEAFDDQRALDFPAAQRPQATLSFRELDRAAQRAASVLHALGVGARDHVGLLLHNGPEIIAFWLGAALLGAVAAPFNARARARELAYLIRQSRVRVLVTSVAEGTQPDLAARVSEALPGIHGDTGGRRLELDAAPDLEHLLVLQPAHCGGVIATLRDLSSTALPPSRITSQVQPDDVTLLMYTSGTTSEPKGCLLTHRTVLGAARAMAFDRYRLTPGDRLWNPLPMFHLSSLHPFTACLYSGCAFLSMTHFDATVAAAQITDESVTVLYPAFPTIVGELLQVPGFAAESLDQLRRINCVAPPDGLRRLQQRFPQAVVTSVYGLTEAGGVVAYGDESESLDTRVTSCGRPFEGIEARIAALDGGASLPADTVGEIQLRGGCLFAGYFEQPQATCAAMTDDGWLRTGDLGTLDAQGRIQYRGRLKDVIKVGGENVSALEVESTLMRHPSVKLAQVVGREDSRYGEVPVAFIELERDAASTDASVLLEFCRGELASFKVPREIHFVTEWPMSATKIRKASLRERLQSMSSE